MTISFTAFRTTLHIQQAYHKFEHRVQPSPRLNIAVEFTRHTCTRTYTNTSIHTHKRVQTENLVIAK